MAAASSGLNRFYLLLGAVAVAGGIAIVAMALRKPPISIPANPVITESDTAGFHGYLLGSDSAPLTVTEYADYQCPACQQWATVQFPSIQDRLIRTGRVRWRYRDLPLDIHPNARPAAHAAACADEQGKYWPMNARLYSWDPDWTVARNPNSIFQEMARGIGLDLGRFNDCMDTARYAGRIQASRLEATRFGVGSTPTFLINGRLYPGGNTVHYDMLKALLDSLSTAQGQ